MQAERQIPLFSFSDMIEVELDVTEPFALYDVFYDANLYYDATETETEKPFFEVTRIYQLEAVPEVEREPHRDDFKIVFTERNVPQPRRLEITFDRALKFYHDGLLIACDNYDNDRNGDVYD